MIEDRDRATEQPDGWLDVLLVAHQGPSRRLQERRDAAVEAGLTIARLRAARERQGLPLLGIPSLLNALAAGSAELVASAASAVGLDLREPTRPESAGAWARLASALGLRRDEALLHLRLTFAELAGGRSALAAVPRAPEPRDLDPDGLPAPPTVADLGRQIELDARGWAPGLRQALRACERAVEESWPAEGCGPAAR